MKRAGVILAALISALAHADAARLEAMMALEYVDAQQCFISADDQVMPIMPALVASDGLPEVAHELVIAALDAALARGCDIHQADAAGLSPLNGAILYGNARLVDYLLQRGADPRRRIEHSSESALNGLDSFAFVQLLQERGDDPTRWAAVADALATARSQ